MAKKRSSGSGNTYIDTSGGVKFGGNSKVEIAGDVSGGDKKVAGGDIVGRDKIVKTSVGMSANDVAKLFNSIYQKIDQKPKEDQADIRNAVDVIKTAAKSEAVDGKAPEDSTVKMASQALATTAPDILKDVAEVALAAFTSPATAVATIIRKVIDKAKAAGQAG